MGISFGSGTAVIDGFWTTFKTSILAKGLSMQYVDDGIITIVYAFDGPSVVYRCQIYDGSVAAGLLSVYSQAQNDADKSDFTTNFQPYVNKSLVPKSQITLGYNTSSGSNLTVIRATAYTEQVVAAQRSIASSSASDTSAGTGARTVKITYYDVTMLGPFTETVTLNGTTAVNTTNTNICFIEKIEVMTVGNQLSNVGTITLSIATGGTGGTIGTIPAGDGITNWCHHYVGNNKTMQLISVVGSIKGTSSGALEVHRTIPTDATRPELTIAPKLRIDAGDSDKLTFDLPILITGPALVLVYGRSDSSTGTVDWSVGMGYYEV